jgi:hypothetical protein
MPEKIELVVVSAPDLFGRRNDLLGFYFGLGEFFGKFLIDLLVDIGRTGVAAGEKENGNKEY